MSLDGLMYWKDYYKCESDEDLKKKLIFSESKYEKEKVAQELERRSKENA